MSPFGAPPLLPPPLLPPLLPPQAATSASAATPAAATVASFRPLSMSSPSDRAVAVTTRSASTTSPAEPAGCHASDGATLVTLDRNAYGRTARSVDRDARVMAHPPRRNVRPHQRGMLTASNMAVTESDKLDGAYSTGSSR